MVYLLSVVSLLTFMAMSALLCAHVLRRSFASLGRLRSTVVACFATALLWELFFVIDSLSFGGIYRPEIHSYGSWLGAATLLFWSRVVFDAAVFFAFSIASCRLRPIFENNSPESTSMIT